MKIFIIIFVAMLSIQLSSCAMSGPRREDIAQYSYGEYRGRLISFEDRMPVTNATIELVIEGEWHAWYHSYQTIEFYKFVTETDSNGDFYIPPWKAETVSKFGIRIGNPILTISRNGKVIGTSFNRGTNMSGKLHFYDEAPEGDIPLVWDDKICSRGLAVPLYAGKCMYVVPRP